MKKNVPFVALLFLFGVAACGKEPDNILTVGEKNEPDYLSDVQVKIITGTYISCMEERGYVRTSDKATADLGIQLTYIGITLQISQAAGGDFLKQAGIHSTG